MTYLRGDSRVARELNRALVFDRLRERRVVSRAALARETGLSKATISELIEAFLAEGLVQAIGPGKATIGRRPALFQLEPRARLVVGLELGSAACHAVLVDLTGVVVHSGTLPVAVPSAEQATACALALVRELVAVVPPGALLGIGVGSPGVVDPLGGVIRTAPDLHWADVAIGPALADQFGVPVACLNRAKAAALAEAWHGAGATTGTLIYLSINTGIAAGIVIDRRLYRGATMSEGEFGHVTVLPDGPLCTCGNRGCLQALAAGPALLARLKAALRREQRLASDVLTLEQAATMAAAGDPLFFAVLDEAATYLGIAAANLVNLLNPRTLILGGAVARALPMLVPRVEAIIRQRAMAAPAAAVTVVPSQLGAAAVPLGAATFLLNQVPVVASALVHSSRQHASTAQLVYPVAAGELASA